MLWFRAILIGCATALGAGSAAGQVRDTLPARDSLDPTRLDDLEVHVTRGIQSRLRVPATVAVVDSTAIRGAQLLNGIDESLGRVPGLYVANRFNPSLDQRLVIRGAGARANFGIRGIKVLLDGIPQTLPDGQTQLTNLDLGLVERVEVLLGGSSALYGNAGGGVISFATAAPRPGFGVRARATGGAFGTTRLSGAATGAAGLWSASLGMTHYRSDGSRAHSAASTTQLSLGVNRVLGSDWLVSGRWFLARSPEARNPGALTREELAADRDAAAPNNLLRGADKSVTQHQVGLTATKVDQRGNRFEATVFGLLRDLVNPLATAPPGPPGPTIGTYSAIDRLSGGARVSYQRALDTEGTRLSIGADLQSMRDDRINRRSNGGAPTADVVARQRETVTEIGPYVSLQAEPTNRLTVIGSARYDQLRFRVRDRFLADDDQSGSRSMGAASASLGASYALGGTAAIYGTVATAFETPTTTELVNQADGTVGLNRDLGPQRTLSTELGIRTTGPVAVTVAVYRSSVRDALVQAREQDGRAYFENAGRLRIRGIEAGLGWRPMAAFGVQASYSRTDARFSHYLIRTGAAVDTLDGREVPGAPRHLFRGIASVTIGPVVAEWDQQITSGYFADDRNTIPVDGWGAGVTSIRLRADVPSRTGPSFTPFLSVNNLWNRRYVASVTVNGFGGRVFEPAPGRWAFVGMEVGF